MRWRNKTEDRPNRLLSVDLCGNDSGHVLREERDINLEVLDQRSLY